MKLFALFFALTAFVYPLAAQEVTLVPAFPNLTFTRLMDIQAPPDGSDRLFAVEKDGVIRVFLLGSEATDAPVFLDIQDRVTTSGDQGLQSVAFHPDFENNGYFYLHYSANNPLRSVIARYGVSQNDATIGDPSSEVILLEVPQPATNHNGGKILFGPDGYLYIPFGDGGNQHDPDDNGQNLGTLLSSVLRIDVDNPSNGLAYGIPEDNPFAGNLEGFREEIYAYGFREPWRSSFGPLGKFWVADVGQGNREEVNWVTLGGNHGWNVAEGSICHSPSAGCDQSALTPPVWEYTHSEGSSITGGYVYTNVNDGCVAILDKYIYADYVSRAVWAITYDNLGVTANTQLMSNAGIGISTFGVDNNGTLYLSSYGSSSTIHKFSCSDDPPLPVALTSFDVLVDSDRAHLSWETASELNNAGFEVQYKNIEANPETSAWLTNAFLKGAGTTNDLQSYTFIVEGLTPGRHTFRLKQIDFDGTFAFSEAVEVSVEFEQPYLVSPLHPNPFNPQTQFSVSVKSTQKVQVDVYDLTGRHIQSLFNNAIMAGSEQSITWDAGAVPSGVYYIRIKGENFLDSQRAVLIK